MGRQRIMAQMKEQIKTPEKELNKMEISNLSGAEFKTVVIKMLDENFSSVKKTQSERKDTLIKIRNNLQGNNSRVDEAKSQISDLEHKEEKDISTARKKKKSEKIKDSVRSLWDNFKDTNTHIIWGARKRRERARNWKSI